MYINLLQYCKKYGRAESIWLVSRNPSDTLHIWDMINHYPGRIIIRQGDFHHIVYLEANYVSTISRITFMRTHLPSLWWLLRRSQAMFFTRVTKYCHHDVSANLWMDQMDQIYDFQRAFRPFSQMFPSQCDHNNYREYRLGARNHSQSRWHVFCLSKCNSLYIKDRHVTSATVKLVLFRCQISSVYRAPPCHCE